MDKKFTILGAICILAAILLGFLSYQQAQKAEQYRKDHPELFAQAKPATTAATATASSTVATPATTAASGTTATGNTATANTPTMAAVIANGSITTLAPAAPADTSTTFATQKLSNDYIDVTLTEDGGAIKTVTLKKFPAQIGGKDPLVFNANAPRPALSLSVPDPARLNDPQATYWSWTTRAQVATGSVGVPPVPLLGQCKLDASLTTNTSVTFRGTTPNGLEFVRTYTLSSGDEDPYVIHHTTTIVNHSDAAVHVSRIFVNVGMPPAPPPEASSYSLTYLDFTYFNGESANYVTVSEFMASPPHLLGLIAARPKQKDYVYAARPSPDLHWVSVKDTFFAAVLTPKGITGSGFYVRGVEFQNNDTLETTLSGDMEFNLGLVAPGAEKKLDLDYYVGPKEYERLDRLGDSKDLIMQFGILGGFSKVLLVALIAIHTAIAPLTQGWGWGWTIIVFTLIIKGVTWPLYAVQVRSTKRMQQLSGPMKALKEKYKDNPQKYQTEVMELYKKNKINPVAGCLPMLIIMPIFLAFISVMRTSSEMRFQPFFWIHDLSAPDTIAHIGGFAINLLPLLMSATSVMQMHLMPSPSADPTQKNVMKFMPLIMLGIFYTMPAGMLLYYTCLNLFTILQQYLANRRKDGPATPPIATPAGLKAKRR